MSQFFRAFCRGSNAPQCDKYVPKEAHILFKKAVYADKHVCVQYQAFVLGSKLMVGDYL